MDRYLDSTFCSHFHSLKLQMGTEGLELVGQVVLFVLSGGAALMSLFEAFLVLRKQCSIRGTCNDRLKKSAEELAKWSVFGNALRLVLLITPILFYRQIFMVRPLAAEGAPPSPPLPLSDLTQLPPS